MRPVLLSVEGQTEETFVRDHLAPYLSAHGLAVKPVVLATKRTARGGKFKGGVSAWAGMCSDIQRLLQDSSAIVSTMFDLYGLPSDVPGKASSRGLRGAALAQAVESAMESDIANPRFRAYLQCHEFEALIYVDPARAGRRSGDAKVGVALQRAVQQCGAPEDVNDDPSTAPSKRLVAAWPRFVKTVDGPALAGEIGIDVLREACPHFSSWIERLTASA